MSAFIPILSFIIGTFWGSFFYTLALRYADGRIGNNPMQALFSRSGCPVCKATINPLFLFPVVGYLLLRGRCRSCGARISPAYPAMEMLYGALATLFAWKLGATLYAFNLYLIAGVAICISIVDLKSLIVPGSLVVVFIVLSLYPILINYNFKDNIFGMLVLLGVFLTILLLFPGAFGGGDVKFGAAIGFLSGMEMSILVLEISLVSGAIIGAIYAIMKRKSLKTKMPFAPFLALGLIVSMLYGREMLLLYYRILY